MLNVDAWWRPSWIYEKHHKLKFCREPSKKYPHICPHEFWETDLFNFRQKYSCSQIQFKLWHDTGIMDDRQSDNYRTTVLNWSLNIDEKLLRRVWRYQRGIQNPYIEQEQTTRRFAVKNRYMIFSFIWSVLRTPKG